MDMKRFFLYAIVIAALALAGCGGNGGGGTGDMGMEMCPTGQVGTPPDCMAPPPETNPVDLAGLLMGFGLTAADVGDHEIAAEMSMDVGNATFSCPAGMACTVTVAMADDGTITATSTGGQATASPSAAAMMAYDEKKKADAAAALAKGMGIAMALQASAGPVPGANAATADSVPVAVTRSTTGDAEIKLFTDDGSATVAFADANDITMSAPPAITGWMGQTQSRTDEGTTDMVTVYTDIKSATPQKLEYSNGGGEDDVAIPTPGLGARIVLNDDAETYNGDDGTADDESVTGTLNGIAGTFTCTTGECTVAFATATPGTSIADNTVATLTGDGWTFESDGNVETQATQDDDYMYFGYWLQDEGDNDFAFNTFFGGNAAFALAADLIDNTAAAFTMTESKAVFTGSAAGKYVEKTLEVVGGEATPVAIAGDYFTADATLTAYFGQSPDVPSNMHNSIRGTISNFENSQGDDVNFRINLNAIAIDTGDGTFTGGTVAGVHGSGSDITQTIAGADGGEWEGQFFGPAGETDDVATTLPTGVAGDFQAHFNDAHVVGAFGATR